MKKKEYFEVTSVHREDLEERGFDTSNVDDNMMERLAGKLADSYVENRFWDDLVIIADIMGIPMKSDHDMCDHCGRNSDTWRNGSGELQCDNCGWSETE